MTTGLTGADVPLADHAGVLLDAVGRRTPHSAVALHCLAAAQHLDRRSVSPPETASGDDRTLLSEALGLLAELSDAARRQDEVAEALHQTLLAYLASRWA